MVGSVAHKIILGVTGGIAAYKAAELCRLLGKGGAEVQVVMTQAAQRFITPLTFQALSGRPVLTSLWDAASGGGMDHIGLTRGADLILVAPASADFLARLAQGRADDLLAALCLARSCRLAVAPAMNREMWAQAPTQRNLEQLRADGVDILGPDAGEQACGELGPGRMLEPVAIQRTVLDLLGDGALAGKRVLITAGATFEPIDPVRGITNLSSGKMGYAVARAAVEAGARVHLVSGPTCLATPAGVEREDIRTAADMHAAVMRAVTACDLFIAVAAVADYRPLMPSDHKLKKDGESLKLELVANPDILAAVARLPDAPFCVGFAAETEALAAHADAKRRKKNVPLLVGNLAPDTLGRDDAELTLFEESGTQTLPRADKLTQARRLIAHLATRLKN